MIYCGCFIGNLVGGFVSDRFGRRFSILVGYAALTIVALASSACDGFYALFTLQLIFGMCFGFGIPSVSALVAEVSPQSWRMTIAGANSLYFAGGCLYSIIIMYCDDPQIDNAHWRLQIAFSGLPPACFGLTALFFLHESPAFLAMQGRTREAEKVLEAMRAENGRPEVGIKIRDSGIIAAVTTKEAFRGQLRLIFSRHLMSATLTLCLSAFALMFIFYGNLYAFAKVLPDIEMGGSAAMSLLLGVLMGDIPGNIFGILWGPRMLRRTAVLSYMVCAAACALLFAWRSDRTNEDSPLPSMVLLFIGYLGGRFFISLGYAVLWQFAAEVFPTPSRSTGLAVVLASGRLGSIIAPAVYEVLHATTRHHAPYFIVGAVILILNAFFAAIYLPETKGNPLDTLPADDEDAQVCMPLNGGRTLKMP